MSWIGAWFAAVASKDSVHHPQRTTTRAHRYGTLAALVILGLLLALHVGTAGVPDVYDELPGQYAGPAWQMVDSGEWAVPVFGGVPRLQKPPLVYWLTAASLWTFGKTEFAARLPTALALAALVLTTGALGARLYGTSRGLLAAIILASSAGVALLGKLIMPEPFVALGLAASLLFVVRAGADPGRTPRWALAVWGATALGTLAKGPIVLLYTAGTLAVVATVTREARRPLAALVRPAGLALFLLLVLPWPLYVELRFPGFLRDSFLNEQLGHVLNTHFPRDSTPTPLLLFWGQHVLWWFPWVLFVPAALLARRPAGSHALRALPGAWLAAVALVASGVAQRQAYHTMEAWPAFALLVSGAWPARPPSRTLRLALVVPLAVLAAAGAVGVAVALIGPPAAAAGIPAMGPFAERNSLAGTLAGTAPQEWWRLGPWLGVASVGLLVGAGGALGATYLGSPRAAFLAVAAGMIGPLTAAIFGLQTFAPYFDLKAIGNALDRVAGRDAFVVFDGPSHQGSSLAYYTRVAVHWLDAPDTEFAVRSRNIGRERFVAAADVARRWASGQPVWLITEESQLGRWRARLGAHLWVAARSGTRVLVGNRAASAQW